MGIDEWLDLGEVVEQAHDLIDVGLLDTAREMLDSYGPIYRGAWEIPFLYSRIATAEDRHQDAISQLRHSLRLGGHNPDTYLGLFYAHTEMGRMAKGARYLLRARARFGENEPVAAALIWYYGETGRLREGLQVFQRAQSIPVENPDIYRNAGLIYQRTGELAQAEQCFRAALERSPDSEDLYDLLADLLLVAHEPGRAIAVYEALLERSHNSVHALSRLVFCLGQGGDSRRAEKTARKIVACYPNSPVGYVDLAYVLLNQDRADEALAEVDKALAVAPIEAEAYRVRGIVLSEKGRDSEATEAFESALSMEPENAEIMRDYYHHLRKTGETKAMEHMVRAVIRAERPYCVEDYWFLADHYWEQGKALRAFQCLNRAHKSLPSENELLPPLITIMLDRGHTSYAMPYLLGYAQRAGWDDTMREFVRHRRLRGPMARESMRFLRFYAERTERYREHAFRHYALKWVQYGAIALAAPSGFVLYGVSGPRGALAAVAGCGVLYVTLRAVATLSALPLRMLRQAMERTEPQES